MTTGECRGAETSLSTPYRREAITKTAESICRLTIHERRTAKRYDVGFVVPGSRSSCPDDLPLRDAEENAERLPCPCELVARVDAPNRERVRRKSSAIDPLKGLTIDELVARRTLIVVWEAGTRIAVVGCL